MRRIAVLALAAALLTACSSSEPGLEPDNDTITATPTAETAPPQSTDPADEVTSGGTDDAGPPKVVDTIATGLTSPWGWPSSRTATRSSPSGTPGGCCCCALRRTTSSRSG